MAKPDVKPAERLSRARQRQKLIDACITALHQHGPSRTTIDKVVSIADMSPGIVNFYFETKAALLVAALEHLAVEFETLVLEPLAALRHTPMAALDRLIDLYLDPNVASARKVSVWYSFWGESSSRREYHTICGKRDVAFAALVQDLMARAIRETRLSHLDADAVTLGLIGCLEMMWQDIAFQEEADIDRDAARQRCRAYLRSVFAGHFGAAPARSLHVADDRLRAELGMFRGTWQFACATADIPEEGDYVAWQSAVDRVLIVRGAGAAISAFVNTCLHRPHVLVGNDSGRLPAAFACPADGTIYGLDGTRRSGGVLQPLHVAVQDSMIFVTRAAEKAAEPPRLAPADRRPVGGWHTSDIAADWKLVVEHWADAYFDTGARMFDESAPPRRLNVSGPSVSFEHKLQGASARFFPRLYLRLCESLGQPAMLRRTLVWPNLFIETRPDGTTIRQVLPLAPGRSRIRLRRYAAAQSSRELRAMAYLAARMERAWHAGDRHAIETTEAEPGAQQGGAALVWLLNQPK